MCITGEWEKTPRLKATTLVRVAVWQPTARRLIAYMI